MQETQASPRKNSCVIVLQIGDDGMAGMMGLVKAKGSQQHANAAMHLLTGAPD